ncbi:WecB/TagA/CpsF family glycosyltransferase [Paenibacillus sp.]|uniref:WecB/TagA/CpsF family glycosyltransferase n=1 Tax=Paenibacillus sp. TaxID=58172 RepID=UPI002D6E9D51|nr:WecB/TagA/CpsF family glycosyltransferase [Paenibacillus sp.]HZG57513.1 WecB/TagA/CpsF family glycosyltransferase [Paenibacillus sp.]
MVTTDAVGAVNTMEKSIAVPETVSLFGVKVSKMDMQRTVAYLTEAVRAKRPTHVVTANPIMFMTGFEDESFLRMLQEADLVVPDGAGLVWAARRLGKPVAERVAGFDLVQELFAVGAREHWRVYLLGTSQELIEAARDRIVETYPGLRIVGCRNGFFGPSEDDEVVRDIVEAAPDLLLVGRATDTQDPWIAKHHHRLNVPVMIGVGGSFDVMSGKLKRAPVWMQKAGLEWLHRLLLQPTRWRRMLALPKFALKVMLFGEKRRPH